VSGLGLPVEFCPECLWPASSVGFHVEREHCGQFRLQAMRARLACLSLVWLRQDSRVEDHLPGNGICSLAKPRHEPKQRAFLLEIASNRRLAPLIDGNSRNDGGQLPPQCPQHHWQRPHQPFALSDSLRPGGEGFFPLRDIRGQRLGSEFLIRDQLLAPGETSAQNQPRARRQTRRSIGTSVGCAHG
jgi:hypothetical protein